VRRRRKHVALVRHENAPEAEPCAFDCGDLGNAARLQARPSASLPALHSATPFSSLRADGNNERARVVIRLGLGGQPKGTRRPEPYRRAVR
jgi:hypothetical protein